MRHIHGFSQIVSVLAAFAIAATLQAATTSSGTIPNGTILPVRLDTTLSSQTSTAGKIIHGRLMQDVLLPSGSKLRAGTTLMGKIVSVSPRANGQPAEVTFQFDAIRTDGVNQPISTSLRAIASFVAVGDTQLPDVGADRGTPVDDRTTNQIGGDVVYRGGGPVEGTSGEIVGKPTADGVLVHVSANPDRGCPNAPDAEALQSLWVFSSDACGTYGLGATDIAHHGRTSPISEATLTASDQDILVRSGAGLLLEVQASSESHG